MHHNLNINIDNFYLYFRICFLLINFIFSHDFFIRIVFLDIKKVFVFKKKILYAETRILLYLSNLYNKNNYKESK